MEQTRTLRSFLVGYAMKTLHTDAPAKELPLHPVSQLAGPHRAPAPAEEALVADPRASLTPAQMVERKLVLLLRSNPLPISHLMTPTRSSRGR
jgi:hypothetical protein